MSRSKALSIQAPLVSTPGITYFFFLAALINTGIRQIATAKSAIYKQPSGSGLQNVQFVILDREKV